MNLGLATKESRGQKVSHLPVEQTAKSVGARLRALRKAQEVTLVELAKASGVDSATISRIETAQMTGTLECHIKLASALGAKVTELYAGIEEARTKDAVTVQGPAARNEVYVHEAGKSSMALLTTDVLKKQMMPVLISIEPGGSTHKEEAKVGTEKFLYVLEGVVEAHIGSAIHELRRGASLYFDASIPHSLKNTGKHPAKCLSVTNPPIL